jgi:tetratricopeptide (TPR) repeat protein
MNPATRVLAWGALALIAGLVAWRVVATGMSDRLASEHPQQALKWDRGNPVALSNLAEQQLDSKDTKAARASALQLLAREPLAGQGFAVLARLAEMEGDSARAMLLTTIALRHAPRSVDARAWLADQQLQQGHFAEAFESIDRILRIAPEQWQGLFPLLIKVSENPDLADALAAKLTEKPPWRGSFIETLMSGATPEAYDQIFASLKRRNDLDPAETRRWIERLARDGRWGEAYARWAGQLDLAASKRLSWIYNGGFESAPTGYGFDWRIGDSAGVIIERTGVAGSDGSFALSLVFLGRRVDAIPIKQWLLLPPGKYRLRFRAKAQDVRSDRGLRWTIHCQGSDAELAKSESLNGSFDWGDRVADFDVPVEGCQTQEIELKNAGADGAGKIVAGTILFDDLRVERRQ